MKQRWSMYVCVGAGVKAWPGDKVLPSWLKCVSMPWGPGTEHTSLALMKVLHLLTSTLWPPTSFCGNRHTQKIKNKIQQCSIVLECHSGTLDLDLNDPIKTTLMMLEVRGPYRITHLRKAQFGGIKRESLNGNPSTNCYKAQTVNKTGMGWDGRKCNYGFLSSITFTRWMKHW